MPAIQTMTISFSLAITAHEIPRWRGAFIEMTGWGEELLHNHNNQPDNQYGKNHNRYPLIHYRVHQGKAAIFAINEGVTAIQGVLARSEWAINWKDKRHSLQIEDLQMNTAPLEISEHKQLYKLHYWVGLNLANYKRWKAADGLIARTQLLERLLTNHLLAYCYGMDWTPTERIVVTIQAIQKRQEVRCHKTNLIAFSLTYTSNLKLPDHIAVGKSVSLGYGEQFALQEKKKTSKKQLKITKINQ